MKRVLFSMAMSVFGLLRTAASVDIDWISFSLLIAAGLLLVAGAFAMLYAHAKEWSSE
ncbi:MULTISPECIES: hypothetical protein [unclassified Caballeronia]|uniref:hypothetical protein n=1 Tax=unclassified Caballeronia TaxID=2646786 RepID=UPI00202870BB|nr:MULTISPECIES: hypothetical protein [unclassified Caballeronia]MDR5797467.1 hypothetical protein [Caballeronia sp. LZ008]